MLNIAITILFIGFIVLVHECGHFFFARYFGIGVYEFSIGIGPVIAKKERKNILYSLRALPFGGFVRLAGMDDDDIDISDEQNFYAKKIWQRFIVLAAGSFVNILTGAFIFIVLTVFLGVQSSSPVVRHVVNEGPAFYSGIEQGDYIISANGSQVVDIQKDFIDKITTFPQEFDVVIRREEKLIGYSIRKSEKTPRIGIVFDSQFQRVGFLQSILYGIKQTNFYIYQTFYSLKLILTREASPKELAGPIGIIQLGSYTLSKGSYAFFNLVAMISIVVLVMLMAFVVTNDVLRWSHRNEIFSKMRIDIKD